MMRPDNDLLPLAIAGDQDALAQLLQQHGAAVRIRLSGRIQSKWQSLLTEDDVMQQTYLDAFLDIRRFIPRGEEAFGAWLAKIAERNLLDGLRALETQKRGGNQQRVQARSEDDSYVEFFDCLTGTGTTPSGHAARNEAKLYLTRAIQTLPPIHQQVIQMYDFDDRSLPEIATAIGRTTGAVLMLRARAHRHLQTILGTASAYLSTTA